MSRITNARTAIAAVLLAYALGFGAFPPQSLLIVDESRYVAQAIAFARGQKELPNARVVVPEERSLPSDYPPATSLLQAPFVAFGSQLAGAASAWRWAAWISVLALVVATLALRNWLESNELDPIFALVMPLYAGSLFFGRVAMSDMPSTAAVALALYATWRARHLRSPAALGVAGLATGSILLFRELPVLLLVPFAARLIADRRTEAWPVVAGALIAVAGRLALAAWLFGDPLYVRDPEYGFSIGSIGHNALPYAVILGLLLPGAVLLPFLYRGPWRREFIIALSGYFTLLLLYDWDSLRQNGLIKGLVLDTRFVLPAVPLFAFMAAHRWRHHGIRSPLVRTTAALTAAGIAFGVHPAIRRMEAEAAGVTRAIQQSTSSLAPVITNHDATFKYLSPAYSDRRLILRDRIDATDSPGLLKQFGRLQIVLLDRTDSELFRRDAEKNQAFLRTLEPLCRLAGVSDTLIGPWLRLRVYDITSCN